MDTTNRKIGTSTGFLIIKNEPLFIFPNCNSLKYSLPYYFTMASSPFP
jgi:hypothetical protein